LSGLGFIPAIMLVFRLLKANSVPEFTVKK
jgi:hypothetical protein